MGVEGGVNEMKEVTGEDHIGKSVSDGVLDGQDQYCTVSAWGRGQGYQPGPPQGSPLLVVPRH